MGKLIMHKYMLMHALQTMIGDTAYHIECYIVIRFENIMPLFARVDCIICTGKPILICNISCTLLQQNVFAGIAVPSKYLIQTVKISYITISHGIRSYGLLKFEKGCKTYMLMYIAYLLPTVIKHLFLLK